ncbi:hypothetical protein [Amycolatopsis sp. lyj-84]|uniref:hypothetical protein n=1 Tax=Amycolatopsis sp. lyj-84 TaxID=2789284 RepID=UPI00397DBEF3
MSSTKTNVIGWTLNALFSVAGWLIVWAAKWLAKLGLWSLMQAASHPRTSLTLGGVGGLVWLIGWQWVAGIVGLVLLTGSTWKAAHRASFEATVERWLRSWFRRWWAYRRRWEKVMTRCGLAVDVGGETHLPKVRKVSSGRYWDRLTVKMQVGQDLSMFEDAGEKLRVPFGVERLAVREILPGLVGMDLMRRDPFRTEKVLATPIPESVEDIDFAAIPVGITEFLETFCESMVGGHTAGAGATGSGKSSLLWNPLRGLAPAIAVGIVKPIFIDPKYKELRQGISLVDAGNFGCTEWEEPEGRSRGSYAPLPKRKGTTADGQYFTGDYAVTEQDTVMLLERIADELNATNAAGANAGERDFVPSIRTPLRLICIDELAPLLRYWSRSSRERIDAALGTILTLGRAAGYIVRGLIQEPTKDVFTIRDLFSRRIGFRLPTEDHTDAILTDRASARGADCSTIPESLPGVMYAFREEQKKAQRCRYGHVTDADIAELVEFVEKMRAELGNVIHLPVEPITEYELVDEHEAGQLIEDDGEAAA